MNSQSKVWGRRNLAEESWPPLSNGKTPIRRASSSSTENVAQSSFDNRRESSSSKSSGSSEGVSSNHKSHYILAGIFKDKERPTEPISSKVLAPLFADKAKPIEAVASKVSIDDDDTLIPGNVVTYNTVIDYLCEEKRIDDALRYFRAMPKMNISPSIVTYNTLLVCYQNIEGDKNVDAAFALFNQMRKEGIAPSELTCNALVQILINAGRAEEAMNFFATWGGGLSADVNVPSSTPERAVEDVPTPLLPIELKNTYNDEDRLAELQLRLNQCRLNNEMIEMERIYTEFFANPDLKPNLKICNLMILVYVQNREFEKIKAVMQEMVQHNIDANIHTYGALIDAYCRDKRVDDALQVMRTMSPVKPDRAMYNFVISLLCNEGRMGEVEELYEKMKQGVKPDAKTFHYIIYFYCRSPNAEVALRYLDDMIQAEIWPDVAMYRTIINGLDKCNKAERCDEVFLAMQKSNYQGDIWLYNILFRGLLKVNRVEDARIAFNEMLEKGIPPDQGTPPELIEEWDAHLEVSPSTVTIRTLNGRLNRMAEKGKIDRMETVYAEFLRYNIEPDVITYNIRIKGYLNAHQEDPVKEILTEMKTKKISRDQFTYSTLINYFCKSKQIDFALLYLKKYKESVLSVATVTFNEVLWTLCHASRIVEAFELMQSMSEVKRDSSTYKIMINALFPLERVDDAYKLFKEMETAGLKCDAATYNTVISGLSKSGKTKEALTIVNAIKDRDDIEDTTHRAIVTTYVYNGKMDLAKEHYKKYLKPDTGTNLISFHNLSNSAEALVRVLVFLDRKDRDKEVTIATNWKGPLGAKQRKIYNNLMEHLPKYYENIVIKPHAYKEDVLILRAPIKHT